MHFGYKILRLAIVLFVLVCVMLATRTLLEAFDGTSICSPHNAVVIIRGETFCFPPGITNISSSSFANDGKNQVDIVLLSGMSATLYSAPDGKGTIVGILPDPNADKGDNTTTATYTNIVFQSIRIKSAVSVASSGSGYLSGVSVDSSAFFTPDVSTPTFYGQGSTMTYNQTIAPNTDCSTFNDCSC